MKIATVLSMLLASSAFGAVSLSLTGPTVDQGALTIAPDVGGNFQITVVLDNPDGTNLNGFSMKATLVPPGSVSVTSRAYPDAIITDPNDPSNPVGKLLDAINDLGATGAPFTGNPAATVQVLTLGLNASTVPVSLTLAGSWNDADFNEGSIAAVTYTVVPEPASMILLAAGAAFFARRRRAA